MNKKTGEFSAADVKKPIGHKEPLGLGPGQSTGKVPGRFVCKDCGHDKPDEEADVLKSHRCRACADAAATRLDPAYRTKGGMKLSAYKKMAYKSAARTYKSGKKLPRWMFS